MELHEYIHDMLDGRLKRGEDLNYLSKRLAEIVRNSVVRDMMIKLGDILLTEPEEQWPDDD